ncbi:GxxExxY protein [Hymenobacter bucti]|uniref:GxxExxY protein n=1 Tax=Hymenobacter bucti TaxID=1844114 RepID=A0ABW4QRU6_9BACT
MDGAFDDWVDADYLGSGAGLGSLVGEPGAAYGVDLAVYTPFTHRAIGCAMRVHSVLGAGFPEVIYQRALSIELAREGMQAQQEVETPIYFRGQQIGSRRVDFMVEGPQPEKPILVELKATTDLADIHFAQVINYLEAYHLHVGLLLNFGSTSLQYRRFIKSTFHT